MLILHVLDYFGAGPLCIALAVRYTIFTSALQCPPGTVLKLWLAIPKVWSVVGK